MTANPNLADPLVPFRDRTEAGRVLARMLATYSNRPDVLVLGLPRGGVPIAYEVCRALNAPLDVFLVRKLGVPGQEELAMGAISSGGVRFLNREIVSALGISESEIDTETERETQEMERRERLYRDDRASPDVSGKTVILVDDGLATGSTMRAAVAALRERQPRSIVVAVPVAARSTCEELRGEVDEIVCVRAPEQFHAVGLWYHDFSEVTDEEIRQLLDRAASQRGSASKLSSRP